MELPGHLSGEFIGSSQVLQACTEASRANPGVLCRAVREHQQCMAPSMTIDGDDVIGASMLGLVEEEPRTPTPEEEATLLGGELGP